ncbi:tetraacyldisaccharide 4'-kinase [Polaromonas sp.]|uniref:tetraacyldisaccharide 4'-kinase n=1 Tax=Polaromonas sp. TaxID=1869339 RepID=UPI002FCB4883
MACLLWPVAQVYALLIALRHRLYRWGAFKSTSAGVPLLIVGNVVAGGAGKTPVVIAIVKHLQARGLKVGVVSRGYGRTGKDCREVLASTPALEAGDEPLLILQATDAPVFVAPRRIDAARALLAAHPATALIVCDDGLQHYALQRDIEIAVFDERGVGNGWLLPAGPLREPWPQRLRQAAPSRQRGIDLVLHTGQTAAFEGFTSTRQLAEHARAADGSRVALSSLRGEAVTALAGIAKPESFFAMLRACGLTLGQTIALPDHYRFESYSLPVAAGSTVLCTEKDAVKLFAMPPAAQVRLLAVPLEFSPEAAFLAALDGLLSPLLSSPLSQLPSDHGHQTA